jgi:ribonuclease HI
MDNYTIYTDGAYSSVKDQMGIGIVILKNDRPILEYSKMFLEGTNNKAEVAAMIIGLRLIKNPIDSLTIISDSMYCIGCASLGWKRKKNVKLWEEFDKQFERVKQLCPNVEFKHVKGHSGDKWNERADKLAVAASQKL